MLEFEIQQFAAYFIVLAILACLVSEA